MNQLSRFRRLSDWLGLWLDAGRRAVLLRLYVMVAIFGQGGRSNVHVKVAARK